MKRKSDPVMKTEADKVYSAIHQMSEGNLDIHLSKMEAQELKEVAEDMNHISLTLNTYIAEISKVLSHLSIGDLTISVSEDINFSGNFETIKTALKKMTISLNTVFQRLDRTIGGVEKAFLECTAQSQAVSKNASIQDQELQEINVLMNEINNIVDYNIATVDSFTTSIERAKTESVNGREKMNQLEDSMVEMQNSANAIQEIVIMINNISNKTKLLSLNASIEAARAGTSGKGFSVVASEIGILASQSSGAVSKTTELVAKTLQSVNHSGAIAKETFQNFQNIYEAIEDASGKSVEISESAKKQAESIKNMFRIIDHLSEMGTENAKLAEESVSSLDRVQQETDQLKALLSTYILEGRDNHLLINNQTLKQEANGLIENLKQQLFADNNLDRILEEYVKNQNYVECIYVLNEKGIQISSTIMSPVIDLSKNQSFSPAMPGHDHSQKRYFKQVILQENKVFESHEYISTATGGLCKTFSVVCEKGDKKVVLCIDMMCMKI